MAVIREINARQGLDTAPGSRPSTRVDDSIGQGLRQFGGAVQQAGNVFADIEARRERMKQDVEAFKTDERLHRGENEKARIFTDLQSRMDPSGEGFTDAVSGEFRKIDENFLQTTPDWLRPKIAEKLLTSRDNWLNKATAAQIKQGREWVSGNISERESTLGAQVLENPELLDSATSDLFETIDAAPYLTTAEKAELKKVGRQSLLEAKAGNYLRTDPSKILGTNGNGDAKAYRDAIASIESAGSGDYGAVGPRHKSMGRALGRYQIMESNIGPWSKEALGREVTVDEFMASPQIQDAIFDHKFGSYVKKFGAEGAAQAWFAGPGGVGKTGRKDVLGTDVGSYGQRFMRALGKQGKERVYLAPEFAELPLEARITLYDKALAADTAMKNRAVAQQKVAYEQHKGSYELGIQTGDIGSELPILEDQILTDSDKSTLLKAFRAANKDRVAVTEALSAFSNGKLQVDAFSSDGQKIVDGLFREIAKTAPADQLQSTTEEIVRQSGVVPKDALNAIRSGLESQNISEVAQAAEAAGRIQAINPSVLGRRDGGDQVSKRADLYNTLTNTMGYTKEEAARRISDLNDPEKVRARNALLSSEPVKKMLKDVDADDIAKGFSGITLLGWRLGENDEQRAGMVAEYKRFLEETILDANGDQEIAKDLANKRFQRLYGASDFTLANTGMRTVITRLPPEKTYDPLPDGSFDYIGQQLEDALKAEGVEFDEVRLKEYDETESSVSNGAPAVYQVWYQQNGQWKLYNLPFEANYGEALTQYEAGQQALMDERQKAMEANRAEELRRFPEGRDGPERFSNDKLYYGIAGEDSPMGRAIRSRREEAKKRKEQNAPFIEQDQRDRDAFNALDPMQQRERAMDDYLNGPLLPGSR